MLTAEQDARARVVNTKVATHSYTVQLTDHTEIKAASLTNAEPSETLCLLHLYHRWTTRLRQKRKIKRNESFICSE